MLALRTKEGVNFDELITAYPESDLGSAAAAACVEAARDLPDDWVSIEPISAPEGKTVGIEASSASSNGADLPALVSDSLDVNEQLVPSKGETPTAVGRGQRLRLTQPEGFLFSNEVISTIFARMDDANVGTLQ